MSEKLLELQKHCVIHDKGTVLDFDVDKFAGLIIQECLNHCDWQTGQRIQKYFEYRDTRWAETQYNPKPF